MAITDRPGLTPCPIRGVREIHTVAVHLFQSGLGGGAVFLVGLVSVCKEPAQTYLCEICGEYTSKKNYSQFWFATKSKNNHMGLI